MFLCIIGIWISLSLNKKFSPYFLGVMFGVITIFVINCNIMVEGHSYDFRHITMTMAGFIGGPVTAAIAALISSLYRYFVGGNGTMGGITNIIIFACFGTLLGKCVKSNQNGRKILFWFIVGTLMACIFVFIIAFVHPWEGSLLNVLRSIPTSFLILTPLATTIIFNFYFWTYDFLSKTSILNTIINSSLINLMIFNEREPILLSRNLIHNQPQFKPFIENPNLLLNPNKEELNATKQRYSEISTDGRHFVADSNSFQLPSGEYACVAIVNDVTETKRIQTEMLEQLTKNLALEADLSRSNQLIADIINYMPDGFYVLDHQWRFTFVNKQTEVLLRKTREELLGKVFFEAFPQIQGTLLEQNCRRTIINDEPLMFEYPSSSHKDTWYQVTTYPSKVGLTVYYRDITEWKLARENLIKSQVEVTSILESMTDCFFALDSNLQLTYINRPGEVVFGKSRDKLLGKKMTDVFKVNDTVLSNFHKVNNEKKTVNFEILSETLGGKWLEISAYPKEIGLTCFFRDITNRKKTQNEIARLDRLNLVGQLAAGIGHEIRNPMTTVRGYLQLLGTRPEYTDQDSTFKLMISELDRANAIITEFLSLARTKKTELRSQSLNDLLNRLYPLLEADAFTQNKKIHTITGEIPFLELNEKEITQLILNLSRNGLEAMMENACLTIKSYLQDDRVVLAIQDEGCGIPTENMNKVGTPFFTTKENGTGLGLATCFKIAESHNAKVSLDSTPEGTTFYILFPIPNKK
jgi:PAS domain S-box-containing protein